MRIDPAPALTLDRALSVALCDAVAGMQLRVLEMTRRQLDELARMREVGTRAVRLIERRLDGALSPEEAALFGRRGIVDDFVAAVRAMRQIMVLELEVAGLKASRRNRPPRERPDCLPGLSKSGYGSRLREPPDDTIDCYDFRPYGEAVRWVRKTLGIEAPPDDPFHSPPPGPDGAPSVHESDEAFKRRQYALWFGGRTYSPIVQPHAAEGPNAPRRRDPPPRGPP